MKTKRPPSHEHGFALLTVMFLLTLLASLFAAYALITQTELQLVKSSRYSQSGFNAAEAGLNLRAEEIRAIFIDYDQPEGESPGSVQNCDSGSTGDGDYQCRTYEFSNNHRAVTFISEEPDNPLQRVIPPGESFAGLNSLEYRYNVTSVGRSSTDQNEAILELTFASRAVPLFQFAIFFQEDLEFFNGAVMTVDGPVHTNGDIYLAPQTGGQTNYTGQVTVAGTFYRGMKTKTSCSGYTGTARVSDTPDVDNPNYLNLMSCSGRQEITDVQAWNDNIILDMDAVEVPAPESMDSFSDGEYWQRADLRLALRLDGGGNPITTQSPTGIEVIRVDNSTDEAATNNLHSGSCPGSIGGRVVGSLGPTTADKLRLFRERQYAPGTNEYQRTLEVDLQALLNCLHLFPSMIEGKALNDDSEEGLVIHFAIDGPGSHSSQNNYSVRVRNGAELQSSLSSAPEIQGLTLVSDQGIVLWGDYNSIGWIPAAIMADTTWLLSNNWEDSTSEVMDRYDRVGSATSVYAAIISGIKRTGDANGPAGQDQGDDSNGGGAINIFRFNEWFRNDAGTSIPDFTYRGSLVSLGPPRKSQSTWGPFTYYSAPNRVWSFERRFNDPDNLPPMTPTFIYLRQELFVRDYELS